MKKKRCNMIVIISLCDLLELIKQHESLVEATVSKFFFQGAWETNDGHVETLAPDMLATNNKYDYNATTHVYDWLRRGNVSTYTTTRFFAIKATIDPQIFREAAERGHAVAKYIYKAFNEQERKFYEDSINPKKRFIPRIDLGWFTKRYRCWKKAYGDKKLFATFEDI